MAQQLPNVYSLLGQATTSQYRRRRKEEKDYYDDLKKDQLKAMLLPPLIAGALGIGRDVIGDIAGKLFLPGEGKSFAEIEDNRSFIYKLGKKDQAVKELSTLRGSLKADDRVDKMITDAAKIHATEKGIGTDGDDYKQIKKFFESQRSQFQTANNLQLS